MGFEDFAIFAPLPSIKDRSNLQKEAPNPIVEVNNNTR